MSLRQRNDLTNPKCSCGVHRAQRRWKSIGVVSLIGVMVFGFVGPAPRYVVQAAEGLVGDINNDGTVRVQDLSLLLANWGKSNTATPTPTPTKVATATPAPVRTPTPTAAPTTTSTPAPSGSSFDLTSFGAKGDGVTDDTAAIQRAFDTVKAGQTVIVNAGRTFNHSNVIRARVAGMTIAGTGTLYATNGDLSALYVEGNNVTLNGFTHRVNATSRSSSWECNNITVKNPGRTVVSGMVIKNVTVDNARCAGIFMDPAENYVIDNVVVKNTHADGIHSTNGSSYGRITNSTVENVGDDGIACIAYARDRGPSTNIWVENTRVIKNNWGRAYTAYGCNNMTFKNIYAESSHAGSILLGQEGSWDTYGSNNIQVLGATIIKANVGNNPDHGAIFIGSDNRNRTVSNVLLQDITIRDTYPHSRQIGLVGYGGSFSKITFKNITVTGGGTVYQGNGPANAYNIINLSKDGVKQPDYYGYTP